MKERPILFSAPMVRALLEGRKTQTRRIVKSGARNMQSRGHECIAHRESGDKWYGDYVWSMRDRNGGWQDFTHDKFMSKCPHGQPGDRLWVRETTRSKYLTNIFTGEPTNALCAEYVADGEPVVEENGFDLAWWYSKKLCPSIFMPRCASRLLLEITEVRVERLQDITPRDAMAEGVEGKGKNKDVVPDNGWRMGYRDVWESINGSGSWDANPWVWVINFERNLGEKP